MSKRQGVLAIVSSNTNAQLSDFELFWECYPRKRKKLDAQRAWVQTERIRPAIEVIIAAVEALNKSHEWHRDPEGRYIPYPASWLRDGQWDDEE